MNTPYIIFFAIFLAWKNSNSTYGYLVFPYCTLFFFASSLLLSSPSQILYTAFELPRMQDSWRPEVPLTTLTSKLNTKRAWGMGKMGEGGQNV